MERLSGFIASMVNQATIETRQEKLKHVNLGRAEGPKGTCTEAPHGNQVQKSSCYQLST